jgi:hypothetical protein
MYCARVVVASQKTQTLVPELRKTLVAGQVSGVL